MQARRDKNCPNFELCKEELLRFFAIILISGYHSLPSKQDYWSNQADLGVLAVSESLSRKRFLQKKSMFHLKSNKMFHLIQTKWQKLLQFMILLIVHLYSTEFSTSFSVWMNRWCRITVATVAKCLLEANPSIFGTRFGVSGEKMAIHII